MSRWKALATWLCADHGYWQNKTPSWCTVPLKLWGVNLRPLAVTPTGSHSFTCKWRPGPTGNTRRKFVSSRPSCRCVTARNGMSFFFSVNTDQTVWRCSFLKCTAGWLLFPHIHEDRHECLTVLRWFDSCRIREQLAIERLGVFCNYSTCPFDLNVCEAGQRPISVLRWIHINEGP